MRFAIGKEFRFEAAHRLPNLPEEHPCSRMHGHSYRVEVELSAENLGPDYMVVDFGELAPFRAWIDANMDHHTLNDLIDIPTAELLAGYLGVVLVEQVELPPAVNLTRVRVWETATCWAEWRA